MMLEVEHLAFAFPRGGRSLRDISFTLSRDDVTCILGPNGSGKTTLIRCLLGALTPAAGAVTVDGVPARSLSARQFATKVAHVPQSTHSVFGHPVRDIVLMGRSAHLSMMQAPGARDREIAEAALQGVGLSGLGDRQFATGNGKTLNMGLPARFDPQRWAWQFVFAPQLRNGPDLQDANYVPDVEKILKIGPDVVLSFERSTADTLAAVGIPTVLLRIQTPADLKKGVQLVGKLLGNAQIGDDYARYFDTTLERIAAKVDAIPKEKRPTALYLNPANLTQPHRVAEWWITTAGGRSVTDDGRSKEVLSLAPDVALTFDKSAADLLQANGIPTVMLQIGTPDEIKAGVGLIGALFGEPQLGRRYASYFDAISARVAERVAKIPRAGRPTVLYINPVIMTQPHLIAEWWIPAGGGVSVTDDGRTKNVLSLTKEAVVGANPDFMFVMEPRHLDVLRQDPVLSQLDAVRNGRIFVSPRGAHVWGNRAVELALTPLWLASVLHPSLFTHDELVKEAQAFYAGFFRTDLTREQVEHILSGGSKPVQSGSSNPK